MTTPFDAQSLLLIEAIGAATADWRISLPDDYPLPKWAANLAVFGGHCCYGPMATGIYRW